MSIVSVMTSEYESTPYEVRYGNEEVSVMFDQSGEETLNPGECVEYLNEYQEMVKICFKKQFHIAFMV